MDSSGKQSEGICVGIRMRPLNEREANSGQEMIFKCLTSCNAISQIKDGQPVEGHTYYYDKVFDEKSLTADVYAHMGSAIVKGVMNGINGTIFAYGQTSSGKTHTMLGGGDQKGVLYMAAEDIFNHIASHPHRDFLLRASFVEIYNENIRDLLAEGSDNTVNIREDPRKGVYCEAVEFVITDFDSIIRLLKKGTSKRIVESTAMNDTSSRSHTIFKLVVESRENDHSGREPDGAVLVAALNLVDLAGSESVKHTGAIGQRAKEGGKINQSLLSLSRVIHSLSQPGTHVNFRDSKLTRLLQSSLSGNAKMSIVCCVTSADRYLEETRSTLQFASRAKLVVTHATVNEVLDEAAQLRRLKKELEDLREKQIKDGGVTAEDLQKLEEEKKDLVRQMELLQYQSKEQNQQLTLLKGLVTGGQSEACVPSDSSDGAFQKPKRKRQTWGGEEKSIDVKFDTELSGMKTRRSSRSQESSATMQTEIDTIRSKLLEAETVIDEQSQLIETLRSQSESNEKKIEDFESELSSKDETIQRLEIEVGASAEFQQEQDEKLRISMETIAEKEKEIECLKEEVENANQTLHLGREFELMEQKASLESELAKALKEIQEMGGKLIETDQALGESKRYSENLEVALKTQCEKVEEQETKIAGFESIIAENSSREISLLEKLQALEGACSTYQSSENELKATIEMLQSDLATISEQKEEEAEQLHQAMEEMKSNAEEYSHLNESLRMQLEASQSETKALSDELLALKSAGDKYVATIEELQAALLSANERVQSISSQLSDAEDLMLENSNLIKRCEDLNSELEDSKASFAQSLEDIASLKLELESKTNDSAYFESELVTAQGKIAEMEELETNLRVKVSEMEQELQISKSIDDLSAEKAALETALIASQRERERLDEEKAALLEQNSSLAQEMTAFSELASVRENELNERLVLLESSASSDSESLREENRALVDELSSVRTHLNQFQLEKESEFSEAISKQARFEAQALAAEEKNSLLEQQINALEASLESKEVSLESQLKIVQELQEQVECLEKQIDFLQSEKDDALLRYSDLSNSSAAAEKTLHSANQRISELEENLSSASEQLCSKVSELDCVLVKLSEAESALVKAKESHKKEVESLVSASQSQSMTLTRLSEIELTSAQIEDARRDVQRQLEHKQSELGKLEGDLSKAWQEKEELIVRLRAAEEHISSMTQEMLTQGDSDVHIKKRVSQLQTQNDLLLGEKEVLVSRVKALESEVKEKLGQGAFYSEKLEREISELQAKLHKAQEDSNQVNRLNESMKAMEKRNAELKGERDEFKSGLEGTRSQLDELQELYDALYEECVRLRQSDNAASSEELHSKLAEVSAREQALVQEKSIMSEDIRELNQRLKKLRDDHSCIQQELEAANEIIHEASSEKDKLMQEIDSAAEQIAALTEALEEANSMTQENGDLIGLLRDRDAALATAEAASERIRQLEDSLRASEEAMERVAALEAELAASADDKLSQVQLLEEELEMSRSCVSDANEEITRLTESLREQSEKEQQLMEQVDELSELLREKENLLLNYQGPSTETTDAAASIESLNAKLSELSATLERLTEERDSLRQQLAESDRNATKEQDMLMEAAEIQMDALRNHIEELQTISAAETEAKRGLESSNAALSNEVSALKVALNEREDAIAAVENEIFELKKSAASSETIASLDDEIDALRKGKEELRSQLRVLKKDLDAANEHCAAAEDQLESLRQQIDVKDKRIAHLDACKLTKDQMEKIKVIKEERKKYQEDARTLKKQLQQLKASYDELKSCSATAVAAPSQEFVVSDLKFQMAEISGQLSQSQAVSSLLKDKLKECSTQLEEYEKERNAVIAVLERHGVDVSALIVIDASQTSADQQSSNSEDLADAVSKLAEKLVSSQSAIAVKHAQKQAQWAELEEQLRLQVAEAEDARAQKQAIEKRLEAFKNSARESREEAAALTAEVDALHEQIHQLQEQLKSAERKAVDNSAEAATSSEVQVLEEENIELLAENKQLRIELSKLKAVAASLPASATASATAVAPSQAPVSAAKSKRAFGTVLDANAIDVASATKDPSGKTPSKRGLIAPAAPESSASEDVVKPSKVRKVKAKTSEIAAGDQPGECNQT